MVKNQYESHDFSLWILKCEDAVHNLETVYAHMQMDSDNNFQVTKLVSKG